jgi:hypothetical protein
MRSVIFSRFTNQLEFGRDTYLLITIFERDAKEVSDGIFLSYYYTYGGSLQV